jgi:hypothetical protein
MSLYMRRGGRLSYWDCLDLVAVHLRRLGEIASSCVPAAPRIRFGTEHFLHDLAAAVQHCGLSWDDEAARELIDDSCVHHFAARAPHESQLLFDQLCGETPELDVATSQARLADAGRTRERLYCRRIEALEERARRAPQERDQLRAQLASSEELLQWAHQELAHAKNEVRARQEELAAMQRAFDLSRAEIEGLSAEVERLAELSAHQGRVLEKFENHAILGPALRIRGLRRSMQMVWSGQSALRTVPLEAPPVRPGGESTLA